MSNFSFSHSVFERLVSQGHQKVSLCGNGLKELQESMDRCTGCCDVTEILLKVLNTTQSTINKLFTKQQILRLVQIQVQNKCKLKAEILFGMGRKPSGKRRKCWLPAFSRFSTVFSKASVLRSLKVGILW